jgi:conjugative transfer region protein TrbK
MNRKLVLATATGALLALTACDRAAAPKQASEMTPANLSTELQRCKELGLKAYDDPKCKAAQQESNDRFLGTSKGPGS